MPRAATWKLAGPQFLGHIVHHAVRRPARRHDAARRRAHRPPRADGLPLDRPRAHLEGGGAAAGVRSRAAGAASTTRSGSRRGTRREPGVWYAGTSPQGLFRSDDGGATWDGVAGFNEHPQRKAWCGGDQDGTPDGAKLHSILVDPRDAAPPLHRDVERRRVRVDRRRRRLAAAQPRRARRLPAATPTPSSATTRTACACTGGSPDRLYQQNHCGIYRLDRPGDALDRHRRGDAQVGRARSASRWSLHPRDPGHALGVPDGRHRASGRASRRGGRPAVYRSVNGGRSWQRQATGLPASAGVVDGQAPGDDRRRGASTSGVYFGTTSGEVWGSRDEGRTWKCLARHLPHIYAVEAG